MGLSCVVVVVVVVVVVGSGVVVVGAGVVVVVSGDGSAVVVSGGCVVGSGGEDDCSLGWVELLSWLDPDAIESEAIAEDDTGSTPLVDSADPDTPLLLSIDTPLSAGSDIDADGTSLDAGSEFIAPSLADDTGKPSLTLSVAVGC